MAYVKFWLVVILATGLLSACGGQQKKSAADEEISQQTDGEVLEPIPNPYLADTKKVPQAADSAFQAALLSIQNEQWESARQQLEKMTQQFPQLSGPWVNLGLVNWRQERWDDAENAFEQAIVANPLNPDAYVQFGIMQRERGHFAKAEALYQQALTVWPHNLEAIINLGILYDLYMGRLNDALAQYELAKRLKSEPDQQLEGWVIDLKRRQAQ